jgi:nucleoside phosphorylase
MPDFSEVMSAVKPGKRTAQYKILAALFSLDAHRIPVTAGEVTRLLRLHVGRGTPANVNDALRKYSAYVTVGDQGPPLRWSLTRKGLEHLEELCGLTLLTQRRRNDFATDVGIVCALEDPEFSAVVNALGGSAALQEIGDARFTHVYRQGQLPIPNGKPLSIVATTATSMGLTAAAIVTTQLIFQFRPRIVMMIGIAAGTREKKKQYGDVLVADPSVDYNSGKVVFADGVREFLPDPYPIGLNARLRAVLQKYRGQHPIFDSIRKRWKGAVPPTGNRLHVGPLGAADQVIDDASRVLEIQKNWRKLIGVEMETYGVYRACHESPEPRPRFVSLKAVCDFAAEKSDSWQDYAAFMAAEFSFEFLKAEWQALWPDQRAEDGRIND